MHCLTVHLDRVHLERRVSLPSLRFTPVARAPQVCVVSRVLHCQKITERSVLEPGHGLRRRPQNLLLCGEMLVFSVVRRLLRTR